MRWRTSAPVSQCALGRRSVSLDSFPQAHGHPACRKDCATMNRHLISRPPSLLLFLSLCIASAACSAAPVLVGGHSVDALYVSPICLGEVALDTAGQSHRDFLQFRAKDIPAGLVLGAKWASGLRRPSGEGTRAPPQLALSPTCSVFSGSLTKTPPRCFASGPHPKPASRGSRRQMGLRGSCAPVG